MLKQALLVSLITYPFSLLSQEYGVNLNRKPIHLERDLLSQSKANWVRSTMDFFWFYNEERTEVEMGWPEFIEVAQDGYGTIMNIKWDFDRYDLSLPMPDSNDELAYFNFLDSWLNTYAQYSDIIVISNEPLAETGIEDEKYQAAWVGIPMIIFYDRVARHIRRYLDDNLSDLDIKIYGGSVFQMYKTGFQNNTANQALLTFADTCSVIDGVDNHIHIDQMSQIEEALQFIRTYTSKPMITTEFSTVFLYPEYYDEILGVDQAGQDFAATYGLSESMTVFELIDSAKQFKIDPELWNDLFRSRSWHIDDFFTSSAAVFNRYEVEIITHLFSQNNNKQPLDPEANPWFIDPLFTSSSVVLEEGVTGLPNNDIFDDFLAHQEAVNAFSLLEESKVILKMAFEDDINNSSFAAATTEINEGSMSYCAGKFGKAGVFDGSNNISVLTDGLWSADDFTIAAWIRLSDDLSVSGRIVEENGGNRHLFVITNKKARTLTGGSPFIQSNTIFENDVWYHVVLVNDHSNLTRSIYINGEMEQSNITNADTGTGDLKIGDSFIGLIDDLLITRQVLNEEEVVAIMEGGIDPVFEKITYNENGWSAIPGNSSEVLIDASLVVSEDEILELKSLETTASGSVSVHPNGVLQVNEDLKTNGAVTIESGGSLITFDGFDSENVTIHRNRSVVAGRYSMVGSPIASATSSDLGSSFIYSFDELNNEFSTVAGGTDLIPGQGYASAADQAISFTGVPNAGDITYNATMDDSGYNLVSNPYPAAILDDEFFTANSTVDALYLWDDGGSEAGTATSDNYIVVNTSGMTSQGTDGFSSSTYNGYIGAMQGFFVHVTAASTITFTEAMRNTGSNNTDGNFFRTVETQVPEHVKFRLKAPDGSVRIATLGWSTDANDVELNTYFDSKPFDAQADLLVYTLKNNTPLAIQGVTREKEEVALGVNLSEAGDYTLALDYTSSDEPVYLLDNVTGAITLLSNGNYTFNSDAGVFTDRFTILTNADNVLGTSLKSIDVYVSNNTLYVNRDEAATFKIYSLSGHLMKELSTSAKSKVELTGMRRGIYIITDGLQSSKFFIE